MSEDFEYCAANFFGWAYGDTPDEAKRRLAGATDNSETYTDEMKEKYRLRVFRFVKGNRPNWSFWMPEWDGDSPAYDILEDNIREWDEGALPHHVEESHEKGL